MICLMKNLIFSFFFLLVIAANAQSSKVLFETPYGSFKVLLYDFTPRHQQVFLQAIQDSVYNAALFNRVIKNFVVQGGEHDDDIKHKELLNPSMRMRLPAEFDKRAFHKIGALGAGRDDNIEKASFLHQIYFVVGGSVSQKQLDSLESRKDISFTAEQRVNYLNRGGLPRLDGDYTVFGEVYEGIETLFKISNVQTDRKDYPLIPIPFTVSILKE